MYVYEKIAFATIMRKLIQNRKHMQCQGCTAIFIFKLQMFVIKNLVRNQVIGIMENLVKNPVRNQVKRVLRKSWELQMWNNP